MSKEKLLKELHEKVNAWFEEKPQRPIAQFMLDTMLQCMEALQQGLPTQRALELGNGAASQAESTPEDLSTQQAGTTPAPINANR